MGFGQIEKASKHHPKRAHYKRYLKQSIHRRERQRVRKVSKESFRTT